MVKSFTYIISSLRLSITISELGEFSNSEPEPAVLHPSLKPANSEDGVVPGSLSTPNSDNLEQDGVKSSTGKISFC